jgi:two-component system, sensor histidine kinase and response regulator
MTSATLIMTAAYDHYLVVLSVLISILGAYAAIHLSERVKAARGWAWLAWLAGVATADGIDTWSMHYTGMLAFSLPVRVMYDWPTVLLSLLVGIIGSAAALSAVSRDKIGWPRVLAASIFMGMVGISGMHFTAMEAMRLQGMHHYSPSLATLSVVLAIVVSFMALSLIREPSRGVRYHGSTLLRGVANPVMHYIAMAAVTFTYSDEVPDFSRAVSITSVGTLGISTVPAMVLAVALLTSLVDRLEKRRVLLDELFEQAPQSIILMSVDNRVVRVNREFTRIFPGARQLVRPD